MVFNILIRPGAVAVIVEDLPDIALLPLAPERALGKGRQDKEACTKILSKNLDVPAEIA